MTREEKKNLVYSILGEFTFPMNKEESDLFVSSAMSALYWADKGKDDEPNLRQEMQDYHIGIRERLKEKGL